MLYINGIDQSKASGGGGGGGGTTLTRYNLGPAKDYSDCILYSGPMQNGEYTLTDALDVARCLLIGREAEGDPDTPGTVTIEGDDAAGAPISEVVSIGDIGEPVITTKAFASVASITGAGWASDGTADNITIAGYNILGLPLIPASAEDVLMIGQPGSCWGAPNATIGLTTAECVVSNALLVLNGVDDIVLYIKEDG